MIDLDAIPTQAQFGELVGISQPAVSELTSRGVLGAGMSCRAMLLAYCAHQREIAAGRATSEGGLDLATERARLAREQADKFALQNAQTRRELAPVVLMEETLARTAARVSSILATIKGEMRRRFPQIPSADLGAVDAVVAKAMNACAALTLESLEADADSAEPPEATDEIVDAEASA